MGILDAAKQWMTPERAIAMQGIGMGLSQLAVGQPANLSPAYQALQQRQQQAQLRKVMEQPGLMDGFSPQQQAILATMPESMAVELIMQRAFAAPPDPVKGIEVGGSVINPITGEVIYQGQAEAPDTVSIVTGEQATALGLQPDQTYEVTMNPDGSLKNVSSIGGAQTVINMGENGIDYGEPGAGLVWQRNPDGTIPLDERGAPIAIPFQGGAAWQKQQEAEAAAAEAAAAGDKKNEQAAATGSIVLQDIGRFKKLVENAPWYDPATGLGAGALSSVGGTNAADAKALAETIGANIGFDRLGQMREASPTGGALGNITERELEALRSVLGSISQSQSEPQLLENLTRLETIYTDIIRKASAYPNAAEFGFGGAVSVDDDPLGLFK